MSHDGWDRITPVAYFKNGALLDSATWTFDRVGADGWKYIYDALERLVLVRKNGVTLARYAYDVLGRRIVKRVYSGSNAGYVRMVYRGSAVAVEASAGTLTLGYTSGLGVDNLVPIHRYSDNSNYYVIQDALHSVRGLSRRDGTWIVSWRYGIYGAAIDSARSAPFAVRYRWTGREYDAETGFFYFRALLRPGGATVHAGRSYRICRWGQSLCVWGWKSDERTRSERPIDDFFRRGRSPRGPLFHGCQG